MDRKMDKFKRLLDAMSRGVLEKGKPAKGALPPLHSTIHAPLPAARL